MHVIIIASITDQSGKLGILDGGDGIPQYILKQIIADCYIRRVDCTIENFII